MIRDILTDEVIVEEYELVEYYYLCNYSKLLGKGSTYKNKYTKDDNVRLEPYSRLFAYSLSSSFNNKKFSII